MQSPLTKPRTIEDFEVDVATPMVNSVTVMEAHPESTGHEENTEIASGPGETARTVGRVDGGESGVVIELNRVSVL